MNAYPVIEPAAGGHFGGIETRSWAFAKQLAQNTKFDVSFLVRHARPLLQPSSAGVQLILLQDRLYPLRDSLLSRLQRSKRFPGWKLTEPRWSDLYALPLLGAMKVLRPRRAPTDPLPRLKRIDADLFLTFGVQSFSATVIASAHATGRPAALFLGSDSDLDERYRPDADFMSIYRDRGDVCYQVLQQADAIFCQTPAQQARLEQLFQRRGTQINNPIDLNHWDQHSLDPLPDAIPQALDRYALWIGRADAVHKRPQLLLQLAHMCPEIPFLMIMNRRDDVVEAEVIRQAPENVTILEHLPFDAMPAVFSRACILVNTSSLEGFPNTFLQAAASKVPVASLQVESDFLQRAQAGDCADGKLDQLAEIVRRTFHTPDNHAAAARQFVEKHHEITRQTDILADELAKLVLRGMRP